MPNILRNKLLIVGWLSFLVAAGTALHSLWFINTHTTEGSPTLWVGIIASFLGYSAAAFGIKAYEGKDGVK